MSFANLKRNRSSIGDLVAAATPETKSDKKSYKDDRQWKPTVDKAGNGYAVVRFLPGLDGNVPFVRYWDHGFKGPTGQWYIERSLTSIGQQDPVSEMNSELWATETDDNRAIVRERKRRLHYVANIIVESDPSNPENEGKVFLYTFGKKIFDKVMDMMQPQFQDEEPVNPYDFWEGADFKIKIRKVEGWVNYDKSEFSKAAALFTGDEEKLEEVYGKLHSLSDFLDPANYKSYDELMAKMNKVLGVDAGHASIDYASPATITAEPVQQTESFVRDTPVAATADADDDDTFSYFEKIARES